MTQLYHSLAYAQRTQHPVPQILAQPQRLGYGDLNIFQQINRYGKKGHINNGTLFRCEVKMKRRRRKIAQIPGRLLGNSLV